MLADSPSQSNNYITPLEHQLTAIWEQTLGITGITIHDDFFELGGHSLIAANIFAQIEKIFKRKIPLSILFKAPTIHKLSNVLSSQGWEPHWSSLVSIQPHGVLPPFFAVPGIGGNVLCYSRLAHLLGADQPFYAFQSHGLDGRVKPFTKIEEIAANFVKEMKTIQPYGPYFLGGACIGGTVAYEMAQQLVKAGEKVEVLILFDARVPGKSHSPKNSLRSQLKSFYLKHFFLIHHWASRVRYYFQSKKNTREFIHTLTEKIKYAILFQTHKNQYKFEHAVLYQDQVTLANRQAQRQYVFSPQYMGDIYQFIAKDRGERFSDHHRAFWEEVCMGNYHAFNISATDSWKILQSPAAEEIVPIFKDTIQKHLKNLPHKPHNP